MLFYFTATGNSLYVAKKINANPISIPQAIRKDGLNFKDDSIGIVCPIFAGQPPQMVIDFMRKAKFDTDYFYMVLTYGNNHSDAAEYTAKLANAFPLWIDYIKTISMVDNYLPVFDMNEQIAMDKKVDEQIAVIIAEIAAKTRKILEATDEERTLHAKVAERSKQMPSFNNGEQISVTAACIGCGTCSKVCLVGIFYVNDGKAMRERNTCEFCLACAHSCPQRAIIMSIMDKNPKARYRHKGITLEEIIAANNQK